MDELKQHYEAELGYLRKMGVEFRKQYPKIADRLQLGDNESKDPHVERLLEGFAFLAARIHKRLDDDFPEITDALLNVVYPHYVRPLPSFTIAELKPDPGQGKQTAHITVPRASRLFTRPSQGVTCRFQTCFETTIWPVELAEAGWHTPDKLEPPVKTTGALGVVRLLLRTQPEVPLAKLGMDSLRFYLHGSEELPHALYEVLLNNCTQVLIRDPNRRKREPVRLPASAIQPAGFAEDQSLLPYTRRSFDGYRLLQEYFAFPQKFLFFDLQGLAPALDGFTNAAEILIFLSPFERDDRQEMLRNGTTARAFRLNCTPIVNLFEQTAEPIMLRQTQHEYQIVPDARRQRFMEIFSVESVVTANPGSGEVIAYDPLYSYRHSDDRERKRTFWQATRRITPWRDGGSEMFMTLIDLSARPLVPDAESITCRLLCTNRDLPSSLPWGSTTGDFEFEGGGAIQRVTALVPPSTTSPAPDRLGAMWRLISHLSLNHLSLVTEGAGALQEILRLYDYAGPVHTRRQIDAIRTVSSAPQFARVVSEHGVGFARGAAVEMELDEKQFAGAGLFLFVSVIERFLGMYTSLNSFSQLTIRSTMRREVLRKWPPRSGRKILM